MSHDRARIAETKSWFVKSAADLFAAKVDVSAGPTLFGDAAFHCQQAVEKAIKGFLCWHDVTFRKTHDLVELSAQCLEIDSGLQKILRRAAYLTEYAWRFRYPGDPESPSRSEVDEAISVATDAYENLISKLPHKVSPARKP